MTLVVMLSCTSYGKKCPKLNSIIIVQNAAFVNTNREPAVNANISRIYNNEQKSFRLLQMTTETTEILLRCKSNIIINELGMRIPIHFF